MKYNKYIGYLTLLLFTAMLFSCKTETTIGAFYNSSIECLGTGHDGSSTLRVWGTGKNKADAIEMAKKNAVYEILFKGIRSNTKDCSLKPLITEVNARERYDAYFNRFFAQKGAYRNYVDMNNGKRDARIEDANKSHVKYGIVVTVQNVELKNRLIADGILKQ